MMVGDPAVPVIADTYVKGIRILMLRLHLKAMLKTTQLKEGEEAHIL
jgi:hypothetical protein